MTDLTVTVTGAGSLFGQGILKSLRQSGTAVTIHGLDYFPDAFGFRYCDSTGTLPDLLSHDVEESDWLSALTDAVRSAGSSLLFIGADFEILPLAIHRAEFESATNCRLIVAGESCVRTCKDKLLTVRHLGAAGLTVPRSAPAEVGFDEAAALLGLPFILKPRGGSRSRGVTLVASRADFEAAVARGSDLMVQQHLPDDTSEFSCGILTIDGKVDAVTPLRRQLRDGNTWSAVSHPPDDPTTRTVADYCREVARALEADGPINVQCRLQDGTPMAFEVNPRFSGTTYFRTLLGVNEPRRLLLHHLGQDLPRDEVQLRPGRVRRYFDESLEPL